MQVTKGMVKRFPDFTIQEIQQLKENPQNQNTKKSTLSKKRSWRNNISSDLKWSAHIWSVHIVLGITISSDLKWSAHVDSITNKAAKRLYLLRQLKRVGIAPSHLVLFYCSVIRSVLEYACQVFHCNLPLYLSDETERIQRRALRIIFPTCNYSEGMVKAGLPSLYDRRSQLYKELFSNIEQGDHKLRHLLPAHSRRNYYLRSNRKFVVPVCKTNRYRDSFIISHCT